MDSNSDNDPVRAIITKGIGEFNDRWQNPQQSKASFDEFEKIRTLGTGAFGRVMLIKDKTSQDFYALKILDKAKVCFPIGELAMMCNQIVKTKQVDHVITEKKILQAMSFTYIVKIFFGFQDNSYLYIGLEFVGGGELFTYLRNVGRLSEQHSRLYASQIILAFEYLQALSIIYRDLKPENILIDPAGFLKMTDFGFAKRISGRTYTLCGTPEYIAPEIIENKGYSFAVDWWSMGILIYELNAGHPPFYASEEMNIYEKICKAKFKCPPFFSSDLKDLLRNLIQKDLTRRYGNLVNGIKDVKDHQWFKDINWLAILDKKVSPPYLPLTKGAGDASNFDTYDEEPLKVEAKDKFAKEFKNF